jgi:cobalt-zinc-cadmium efflux system protein
MDNHHTPAYASRRRLVLAAGAGLIVLSIEVAGALAGNSLALAADAAHIAIDVVAVLVALAAVTFGARPAGRAHSFGLARLEILGAAANAIALGVVSILVLIEAGTRLQAPESTHGGFVILAAAGALLANTVAASLLRRSARSSLIVRTAFYELAGDAAGAGAALLAGLVIATTGFVAADSIASIAIALFMLTRAWILLRAATDVLLEAIPAGFDPELLRQHLLAEAGVADVHDLHVWSITSGVQVCSAHIVLTKDANPSLVLDGLETCLAADFDVEHSTIQLELADRRRAERRAHD